MAKSPAPKPKTVPAQPSDALLGTRHPASVPGATHHPDTGALPPGVMTLREFISDPRWATGAAQPASPPPIPRTDTLLIARAPGGYVLFEVHGPTDCAETAIAVAATGPELLSRIADWTRPATPTGEAA